MADLGNDLSCVFDLDASLTVVTGRRALAEAIARRWLSPRGTLFYAPTYGAGLIEALHGAVQTPELLGTELENEALQDERVKACQVAVDHVGEALRVRGVLTDAEGAFRFVLDVSALTIDLLLEASA